jgi:hypothetical protein
MATRVRVPCFSVLVGNNVPGMLKKASRPKNAYRPRSARGPGRHHQPLQASKRRFGRNAISAKISLEYRRRDDTNKVGISS